MLESSGLCPLLFMAPLLLRGRTVSSLLKHKLEKPSQTAWAWRGGRPLPLKEPGARELAVVLKTPPAALLFLRRGCWGNMPHSPHLCLPTAPSCPSSQVPLQLHGALQTPAWPAVPTLPALGARPGGILGVPPLHTLPPGLGGGRLQEPQYPRPHNIMRTIRFCPCFSLMLPLGSRVGPEPILQCRTLRLR